MATGETAVQQTEPTSGDSWRGPAGAPVGVIPARRAAGRGRPTPEAAAMVTRRALVRGAFWSGLGVVGAGFLAGFVNFFWPRKVERSTPVVNVPANQIPQPGDDPKRFLEGKFYLVNLRPGEGVPEEFRSLAAPSKQGGILALAQKCPHLGCTVPWRPEFEYQGVTGWFRCPCHQSTYTRAGVRVFGPAPRSMDTLDITVNRDGSLTVDTGKLRRGGVDNPQLATLS